MPWIKIDDDPDYYKLPLMTDDMVFGMNNQCLKDERKNLGQHREFLLQFQKECGQKKEIEMARFFREEASYTMKRWRGVDLALSWIEISDLSKVSEEIAVYVDQALGNVFWEVSDEKSIGSDEGFIR